MTASLQQASRASPAVPAGPALAGLPRQPAVAAAAALHSDAKATDKRTFEVVRLSLKDKPKIVEFLRRFFYHDEPLNTAIGLKAGVVCPALEDFSMSTLDEGLSVGAVAPDGSLVGVCINGSLTRAEDEQDRAEWAEIADEVPDDVTAIKDAEAKFGQVKRLLGGVCADAEVFSHAPDDVDRLFDIFILSVDDSWRGKGIARKLLDQSRELAQAEGFRLMRCICTSYVSALLVSRQGYRCVHRKDYKDVVDKKGRRIFPTEAPHDAATTYVLDL